ncbi:MAG: hypothetical protein F4X44_02845 [Gammaproteobacteria bacterium]|nr:hypothetical protein [Gammaproteobacteria bacterium]MYD79532.1 hypothetical protein [Gammaproteobacteria bacterium]
MSNPTEKVLEMLVAEKIDVEQSRRLLDRLNEGPNEVEPLSQSKAAIIDLLETEKIDFDESLRLLNQLNERPEEARSLSVSKQKIVDLLVQDKVSIDDAFRLLGRANESVRTNEGSEEFGNNSQSAAAVARFSSKKRPKFLRVLIQDGDSEKVDVRVPLKLVKLGMVSSDFVPQGVLDVVTEHGIDFENLSGLSDDDFYEAFGNLSVDIVDDDSTVRVFCE